MTDIQGSLRDRTQRRLKALRSAHEVESVAHLARLARSTVYRLRDLPADKDVRNSTLERVSEALDAVEAGQA